MNALKTRIEQLPPMHVASVRVVSATPERDAWNRLRRWAEPRGLLRDAGRHPVFGFNNPPPKPNQPEHGYEWWIRVGPGTAGEAGVEIKEFEGGLFLVTTVRLIGDPAGSVADAWLKLWQLSRSGAYRWRGTQELEKPHDPLAEESAMRLDLYLPVRAVTEEHEFRPGRPALAPMARERATEKAG